MLGTYIFITSFWWTVMFIIMQCPYLSLLTFFWFEAYFVSYEHGYTCFLGGGAAFAWSIIFYPFTLSLCVCLQSCGESPGESIGWISWRQYRVGSCVWIHPATLFWLVNAVHLHLGWLLINEGLLLPFYLLFSSFSTSPLSLFPYVSACHFSLVVSCHVSLISSFLCLVSLP